MTTLVKYAVIELLYLLCYIGGRRAGTSLGEAAFRCDYKHIPTAEGFFKHFVIPATWADARLRCSLEGATLASPLNPNIEAEMKHIIQIYFTSESEIFTGFHATISQGNFYSIEGTPLSEISLAWAENEPNNVGNNENCITFNANGEMADRSCNEPRPYICFRSAEIKTEVNECGTIDSEYKLDQRTNSCYKFHTVPRTFSGAHFACSAEGGHLAIINSNVEATVLRELFAKYPSGTMFGSFRKDFAFVGFHDWGETADWRTIHGQTLEEAGYKKFASGEPNNATTGEYCGGILRTALLCDLWCERPAPFICEKKRNHPHICLPLERQSKFDVKHGHG